MELRVSYDPNPQVDVLGISTGRQELCGADLPEAHIIIHSGTWEDNRDIAGVEILFAADYVAPYFQRRREGAPFKAGNPARTRYDRETDTLTWGMAAAEPEMVSCAGDLTAYWQPDPDFEEEEESFFEPIGLALRNASKHLAPWFELAEPAAAAGRGGGR